MTPATLTAYTAETRDELDRCDPALLAALDDIPQGDIARALVKLERRLNARLESSDRRKVATFNVDLPGRSWCAILSYLRDLHGRNRPHHPAA